MSVVQSCACMICTQLCKKTQLEYLVALQQDLVVLVDLLVRED